MFILGAILFGFRKQFYIRARENKCEKDEIISFSFFALVFSIQQGMQSCFVLS